MSSQQQNTCGVISAVVIFLCIQCASSFPNIALKHMEINKKIDSIREVARIKNKILQELGMTVPHTTPAVPSRVVGSVTPTIYKRSELTVYRSEPPENYSDNHIIQFNLTALNRNKISEVSSVNLLIRVKIRRKKSPKLLDRGKRSVKGKLNNIPTEDNLKMPEQELDTKTKKADRQNKRQAKRRQKKKLTISLTVSNVTVDGKPDFSLAAVNSTLKKTKTFNLALPTDKIYKSLASTNSTLQLYVQCLGCGRKASLILLHKNRKRKRANHKRKDLRSLHKRRPRLFVESLITQTPWAR